MKMKKLLVLATASLLTGFCLPSQSLAVGTGDLFFTTEGGGDIEPPEFGTILDGIDFQGVPLGTYNFGGSTGMLNVGNTDTIIQRLPSGTLQLNTLQLQSVAPISGDTYYYVTLDGSQTSGGTFNINANGTFSSDFDVYYDVRAGSLTGPIVNSGEVGLTGSGTWQNNPTPNALLIPGVNYLVNGVDTSDDLWLSGPGGPGTPLIESDAAGDQLVMIPTEVPEPSGLALLCCGVLGLAIKTRRG